jgi:hypothetical protein
MRTRTILLLAGLLFGFSGAAQIPQKQTWKSLDGSGYSIQYPEGWEVNKSGQMGTSFILLSQQETSQDLFRENVNLLIQDLTGMGIDLGKYAEISESQIKTLITNGNLLESKRQNRNGFDHQKVIYTGDQGIYKLKFEQYYFVRNEKAIVLTLTCEIDQFEKYQEIGEKILNSFRFN